MPETMSLSDLIQERLNSQELELPVFAPMALELQEMVSRDNASIDEIARRISQDQALSSQVLRMANSAFYGGLKQISTIKDSIMRLGTQQVLNLVLLSTQHQQYDSQHPLLKPYMGKLWKHACACAVGSKWLADKLGCRAMVQEAFMAGLLHDIGHLVLLRVLEDIHKAKPDVSLSEAALAEVLDSMHTTQGSSLLRHWNLPDFYCEVVNMHHDATYDYSNFLLSMVRLADVTCYKLGIGLHYDPTIDLNTTNEVQALQASDVLLAQLEILLEDAAEAFT